MNESTPTSNPVSSDSTASDSSATPSCPSTSFGPPVPSRWGVPNYPAASAGGATDTLLTLQPRTSAAPWQFDLSIPIIVMTAAVLIGTVLSRPYINYGDNDASRINTVYYLVEHGTYEYQPDVVNWARRKKIEGNPTSIDLALPRTIPVLQTVDMIVINGKPYSSKPPMQSTCLAGIVWVTQKLTHWAHTMWPTKFDSHTMHDSPWMMVWTMIIVSQVVPLIVMFLLLRRHIFRATDSPFVRNFSMLAVCTGTFLSPWSLTINNHVPAAVMSMIAIDAAMRIWYENRREFRWFALAGFFAAFTATIELPAALLAVTLFVALLICDARRTLIVGLIAAAIPTITALYTNHLVTGQLMPAYESWDMDKLPADSFYNYPGSYWLNREGTDALKESRRTYLTHILVGHNGFFSLTPLYLVSLLGIGIAMTRSTTKSKSAATSSVASRSATTTSGTALGANTNSSCGSSCSSSRVAAPPRILGALLLAFTVVVIAFYVSKTRNYGGGCHGFRWLFWLIPMWLLFLPYGVEMLSRRRIGRTVLYTCFAVSAFSMAFGAGNPWMKTWLRLLMNQWGWISY